MTTARRRVVLYWLLLLGPALAVGGGALWLLQREQKRVAAQSQAAETARRQTVTERTRLIAENIEVLVSDVQTTLARTLSETPEARAQGYLEGLRRTNPLVADAFEADSRGVIRWGGESAETASWVGRQTWNPELVPAPAPAAARSEAERRQLAEQAQEADAMRKQVSSNVSNYQSARSMTQEVASLKVASDEAGLSDRVAAVSAPSASPGRRADGFAKDLGRQERSVTAVEVQWTPWVSDRSLHVFGWFRTPDGGVRGIALDLDVLYTQLTGVLPVEQASDERYALVTTGSLRQSVGRSSFLPSRGKAEWSATVPLAAALLPGWRVEGQWTGAAAGSLDGSVFFTLTGVLVMGFVGSILVGGGLLLREARRSELEAQQKTSFVANISHELKTPLTTIRMYAELLEQGRVATESKQRDYLGVIGRESARLSRLIGNALDFSRLEQGRKTYTLQEVELREELERLLIAQAPRLEAAGLQLTRDWPGEPVPVKTDFDAVQQIVLNLIDNACKYAAEGGELTVVLRKREGGAPVEMEFSDRGPGVPATSREKIFEKFHRVDDRLTAEQGGAGLGLGIARQLARGLGGDLSCRARAGGGATFILKLP